MLLWVMGLRGLGVHGVRVQSGSVSASGGSRVQAFGVRIQGSGFGSYGTIGGPGL